MKKSIFLASAVMIALCYSSPLSAQANGQAGGMNPVGNSTFGGGNATQVIFNDYALALRLIHQGKYADAIPYLDHALLDRPHSADILTNLGYTHLMIDDPSGSLAYYQKALAIDPDHKRAHEHLGELYLAMHDTASAEAQLAELTRLCPSDCDEKDALAKAIADYDSSARPAAATTPTPATTN
jgi:tetratricopeptide (TPR) repeat protein